MCGTTKHWHKLDHCQVGYTGIKIYIDCIAGHVGTIYDLAVLPTTGHVRLFSASYDKTIRVS